MWEQLPAVSQACAHSDARAHVIKNRNKNLLKACGHTVLPATQTGRTGSWAGRVTHQPISPHTGAERLRNSDDLSLSDATLTYSCVRAGARASVSAEGCGEGSVQRTASACENFPWDGNLLAGLAGYRASERYHLLPSTGATWAASMPVFGYGAGAHTLPL